MPHIVNRFMILTGCAIALVSSFATADAAAALDQMQQTIGNVVEILMNKTLDRKERRVALRKAVLERFAFAEMARRSLGQHWRPLTTQQTQEFVHLFTDLIESSYIKRIESFTGGQDSIRYQQDPTSDESAALIRTTIRDGRGQSTSVDYRLSPEGGAWKVYDVVIEGVSLVNNFRIQFANIMVTKGYDGIVAQMRLKLEQDRAAGE